MDGCKNREGPEKRPFKVHRHRFPNGLLVSAQSAEWDTIDRVSSPTDRTVFNPNYCLVSYVFRFLIVKSIVEFRRSTLTDRFV